MRRATDEYQAPVLGSIAEEGTAGGAIEYEGAAKVRAPHARSQTMTMPLSILNKYSKRVPEASCRVHRVQYLKQGVSPVKKRDLSPYTHTLQAVGERTGQRGLGRDASQRPALLSMLEDSNRPSLDRELKLPSVPSLAQSPSAAGRHSDNADWFGGGVRIPESRLQDIQDFNSQQHASPSAAQTMQQPGSAYSAKTKVDTFLYAKNIHQVPAAKTVTKNMIQRLKGKGGETFEELLPSGAAGNGPGATGKAPGSVIDRVDPHLLMRAVGREINMSKEQKAKLDSLFETRAMVHATIHSGRTMEEREKLSLPALAATAKTSLVSPASLHFLQEQIRRQTQVLDNGRSPRETEQQKKVRQQLVRNRQDNHKLHSGFIIDDNMLRFSAPPIYQYTNVEKQKHSIDEGDFMKYIKRNYNSLRDRGHEKNITAEFDALQKRYQRKQERILYPATSILDDFMKDRGLSKKLRSNVSIVNGEAVFVKRRKLAKREKEEAEEQDAKKKNFFSTKAESAAEERQKGEDRNMLERQKATAQVQKRMMSKDDLVHLLQDSIDKSVKTRVDSEIRLRCQDTRRFITKTSKLIEDAGAIPARAERSLKFSKEEINQLEYEEIHEKQKFLKRLTNGTNTDSTKKPKRNNISKTVPAQAGRN